MTRELLRAAIQAIKDGDTNRGGTLLAQVLAADPDSEAAWLWKTRTVITDRERIHCLHRVLEINPNNRKAQEYLAALQPKTTPQSARSNRGWFFGIAGIAGLGCCFLLVIGAILSPSSDRETAPVAATVPPAQTQPPSPEPPPPTANPALSYIEAMQSQLRRFEQATDTLAGLLRAADVGNAAWRDNITAQANEVQTSYAGMVGLAPPPELAEVHQRVVTAADFCNTAMDYLKTGINDRSIADMNRADSLLTTCVDHLSRVRIE